MGNPKTNGAANGHADGNGKPKVTSKDAPGTGGPTRVQFNCLNCPGYCCSYPVITVTKYDVTRLARYFGISWEEAEKRFTKSQHGYKRILRKKKDEHYGTICRFFDQENRCCGIYDARPHVCRAFPGGGRCGYYDFLMFERRAQNDDEFVALTDHS
jgi:uncharacterized protein